MSFYKVEGNIDNYIAMISPTSDPKNYRYNIEVIMLLKCDKYWNILNILIQIDASEVSAKAIVNFTNLDPGTKYNSSVYAEKYGQRGDGAFLIETTGNIYKCS